MKRVPFFFSIAIFKCLTYIDTKQMHVVRSTRAISIACFTYSGILAFSGMTVPLITYIYIRSRNHAFASCLARHYQRDASFVQMAKSIFHLFDSLER